MVTADILIIILILFMLYVYIGYPFVLFAISRFYKRGVVKDYDFIPFVSIVIAARNEALNIENRIMNLMMQDYPNDKLEIIIISDGSGDKTNEIVEKVRKNVYEEGNKIRLNFIVFDVSYGKPYAINAGVANALGEIIVFTDCRQEFETSAVKELVSNFYDSSVGCVSGELVFKESINSKIEKEMGLYWKYEKEIRKLESNISSVVGATGAIYAVRKKLYKAIPYVTLLDDVLVPLNVCLQGYRTIFDDAAVAYDVVSSDFSIEKKRKIRTLAGNWQLLKLKPVLLIPVVNPVWFMFISHKILRLLIPYLFIGLAGVSIFFEGILGNVVLTCIIILFMMAVSNRIFSKNIQLARLSNVCRTFIFLNYTAFLAPIKLIFSKRLW